MLKNHSFAAELTALAVLAELETTAELAELAELETKAGLAVPAELEMTADLAELAVPAEPRKIGQSLGFSIMKLLCASWD